MLSKRNDILLTMGKTYCIFSALYPPSLGGVEKYTQNLASQMVADGDNIIIVTSNIFNKNSRERLSANLEIIRLPSRSFLRGRLPFPKRNKEYRQLLSMLASINPGGIIINTRFYPLTLVGLRFAKSRKVKPVLIDHGSAHLSLGIPLIDTFISYYEHIITKIVKSYDVDFYAVSKKSVQWLEHFGICAKGIINNSIDVEEYVSSSSKRAFRSELGLPDDAFAVCFTGRLVKEKGLIPLLEAASLLGEQQNIVFLIAGDGPLSAHLSERNLPNVHLLGRLSASDVSALLQASDAFCLPSQSEGFSSSLLEAAACQTTPIVTQVGGVEELVPDEKYGIVIPNGSGLEISQAILKLSENRDLCRSMGRNIYMRVLDGFSWKTSARRIREACQI